MSELKALHLKKTYKKRTVVSDVSISVESGSIVGLLGPNGAGKTTSFYMIVGIVSSEDGQVLLDNEDITEKPMHERARAGLGYLPQENSIFRKLTVYQNLMGVVELIPGLNKQEKENRVNELLDEFSVGHLRNNTGMSLSGGERRRVEIARALAASPKFILLDEPFAGVDPISVGEIKEIIVHLKNRGIGILITDHNVRETLDVCERSYIVNAGKIIAQGSAEEVLANDKVKQVYLGKDFSM
ncbi:MAG: LPS export ABC transporter ATP-binding protein [Succinivibrio sp.]|jgi:lipopolysaccharide export system ATP-binding protein|nr:LPS export ABC transporter ATP-binding protein [Succinivibrio sp.]MBR1612919.1 LPS export ABC transporter ATP-binding protein [Succinivibrio sp.]